MRSPVRACQAWHFTIRWIPTILHTDHPVSHVTIRYPGRPSSRVRTTTLKSTYATLSSSASSYPRRHASCRHTLHSPLVVAPPGRQLPSRCIAVQSAGNSPVPGPPHHRSVTWRCCGRPRTNRRNGRLRWGRRTERDRRARIVYRKLIIQLRSNSMHELPLP